jgi:hypothetical protein
MSDASQEEPSVATWIMDIDVLFVVTREPSPARHPAEAARNDTSPGRCFESRIVAVAIGGT